ncbi:MAG: hypothetical protein RL318_2340 [Fibrobacterota bacterium]|jgi:hypothetical protein
MIADTSVLRMLRRMVIPAVASVIFFVSCQQLGSSKSSGNPDVDSVRVALAPTVDSGNLADGLQAKVAWMRVQFGTMQTDTTLLLDTIVPWSRESFVSPAFPTRCGYFATVTGLDTTFRKVWGGGATRRSVRAHLAGSGIDSLRVPVLLTPVLKADSASLPSGAIDFPRIARFPARIEPGARRVCSFDGVHWAPCPNRLRIDSTMSVQVQVQSVDTMIGAPHSRVVRQSWTAKPVAAPVWRLKRHRDLPGQPWRAWLRTTTRGAKIEWSADSGKTWNAYKWRFRIRPGKLYLARAIKAHQGESPAVELSWKRSGRVLKASQVESAIGEAVRKETAPGPTHHAVDSTRNPASRSGGDSTGTSPRP